MNQQHLRESVQVVQTDLASLVVVLVVGPLFSQFVSNSVGVAAAAVAPDDCLQLTGGWPDVQGSGFHS
jgi:hypothetical protein